MIDIVTFIMYVDCIGMTRALYVLTSLGLVGDLGLALAFRCWLHPSLHVCSCHAAESGCPPETCHAQRVPAKDNQRAAVKKEESAARDFAFLKQNLEAAPVTKATLRQLVVAHMTGCCIIAKQDRVVM
jgi:hypothetical protein